MSAIGVLNLIYSADTNALVRGTAKARSEVKGIGEVVESTKSHIGGLLAGVGAALGINSLKDWVLGSMEAINSTPPSWASSSARRPRPCRGFSTPPRSATSTPRRLPVR